MGAKFFTKHVADHLRQQLIERGELAFPVGVFAAGFLSGTYFRIKKNDWQFIPRLRTRIISMLSSSYANLLAFILWIGPENVWVLADLRDGSYSKFCIRVRVKPNKALKCAPSGPDAAALRRLT